MALYKGDKRYTIGNNYSGNIIPLEVTKDGVYTAPTGVSGYSPVTMKNNNPGVNFGTHCDNNGIWHKPEEWDDIESIDLTGKHEVYFLCACHRTEHDWFRIRFYGGGTLKWSYGHVSNGTYTIHADSTETTVSSGSYIALYLANLQDDYIVVRITSTSYITSCAYAAWSATADLNCNMPAAYQSVLMRYGRMVRGTSLGSSTTYCLESDNILDFASYYWNTTTTITVNSAYVNAFNLQRWRCTGWDLAKNKITNFSSMFSTCWSLCDVPNPLNLDGWVTSNTTTVASMFNQCRSMNTNITVNNWDLSNITTMGSLFNDCYGVKSIVGTETWNSAPKCTNISNMFSGCRSVRNKLDLSKCYFGNGTANLTTAANLVNACYSCPEINISNINLSKCTTVAYLIATDTACKKLTMNNVTAITSVCTTTNYLFLYTAIPELTIDGWDFSGITASGSFLGNCNSCGGLKKLIFKNCISPSSTLNDSSTPSMFVRYSYTLEYLDVSFMDMSIFSSTTTHAQSFRDLYNLIEFYPPKNISKSFNLTNDSNLNHDSLVRVINNLVTLAANTTATLTIGTYNLSKLSAAEQAVATEKGWTLA